MQLNTKYHGIREYKKEDVWIFNKGLCGFENLKNFILFPVEENKVFSVLHSIEDSSLGFIVVSPFIVDSNYEFKLTEEVIKRLNVSDPDQVLVLNTVTLNSNMEKITTNLRAPIIINIKEGLGEQIILENEKYLIKHPIFKEAF